MAPANRNERRREETSRAKQETKVLSDILDRLRHQLSSVSSNIDILISSGDYYGPDYQAERRVLMEANNVGVREGIVATCATFLFLRHGPRVVARLVFKRLQNRQSTPSSMSHTKRTGGYQLDPRPTETTNPFTSGTAGGATQNSTHTARRSTITSMLVWTAKLGLDIFASLLLGAYTSLYFTDEKHVLTKFATLPLIEGRSLVADEMCEAVYQECAKLPPEFWASATSPYLRNMKLFAENCARRRAFEKAIIREQQHSRQFGEDRPSSDRVHVRIPAPGVPMDYELDTGSLLASPDDRVSEDGSFLGVWNDDAHPADEKEFSDWADGITQDQEGSSKSNNKKGPWY